MKKISLLIILSLTILMTACAANKETTVKDPYTFTNGDFELGTLEGWTTTGQAFSQTMVSFQKRDSNNLEYRQQGMYFFHGGKGDLGELTGTMTSSPFVLKGNGIIGF